MKIDKNEVFSKLANISSQNLEDISENSNLVDDLGLDSIDLVELLMEIESSLDIEIPEEVAVEFKTVKDVIDYIEKV